MWTDVDEERSWGDEVPHPTVLLSPLIEVERFSSVSIISRKTSTQQCMWTPMYARKTVLVKRLVRDDEQVYVNANNFDDDKAAETLLQTAAKHQIAADSVIDRLLRNNAEAVSAIQQQADDGINSSNIYSAIAA